MKRFGQILVALSLGIAVSGSFTGTAFGAEVAYMDNHCSPTSDFYVYANGTWLKKTPIPDEYDKWGQLNIIHDKNLSLLKEIMEAAAAKEDAEPGSNEQKIGDFYAAAMNTEKIEKDDLAPLKEELDAIAAIKSRDDLLGTAARLQSRGINAMFNFSSGQDFKDSTRVIGQLWQAGLGLPDRDYYTNEDAHSKELRQKYVAHIGRMLELSGYKKEEAAAAASKIMKLETALAEGSMKNTDLRDPDKVYHKMTVSTLSDLTPNFSWTAYLKNVGRLDVGDINVGQPDFFKTLDKQLTDTSVADWKHYLTWHLVDAAAPYLSTRFVDADFDFHGRTLTGKKQNLPRWKRVINAADRALGEAVGQLYVNRTFSPEAKERALDLVNKMKEVLKEDLASLDWMDDATRKNAIAKLEKFGLKIGYPDRWRDYSKLEIDRDSYLKNILSAERFEFARQLDKIGKPVDRNEWFMSPQTVNAYYSAELNEIVFPAGILQPPIFDPDADDATNLGAMGMVIGHEMTHGFDDQGSKFDGDGNLKNWWSEDDLKRFKARIALIESQYESYKVIDDLHFKGKLVAGEAAADLGGLTIAYKTLKKVCPDLKEKDDNGFTPEKRFFLSFAQAWATNIRPEKERLMLATDPHPTPHYRVNGTVANMDVFEDVFGDDEKTASMMLPSDKRCRLW